MRFAQLGRAGLIRKPSIQSVEATEGQSGFFVEHWFIVASSVRKFGGFDNFQTVLKRINRVVHLDLSSLNRNRL